MIKGKSLSLKHRVLIYFVLISVVAITSLSLGGVHFLENTLLDKDSSTSRVLAKEVHYNVNQVFTRAERDMGVIAAHPIINDKSFSMKQKLEKLKQLQGLIGDFENVSLLNLDGEILATTNFNYRGGVKYASYFKKTLKDKATQVSPAYFTLDPKHIVFSFTTPVYDQTGEMTYIMYAQLNVNQVTAVIGHLDFGESGEAQLIDEYGRFIAGVSDDELLTPVSGSLSEKLSLDIQGFRFDREGVRHGSAYREGRMTVVVSQSYQAVLSVIEKSLNKLIIYSVLVLVIVVIVGVYFSYTISRPLDSLVENIRSYSKGDRYQTSNSSTVPEEIGVLGESFNNMLGQIEQYQDEMEQLVSDRTEELAHARDRAEAANRTKTLFLKNMSHEIRTPMNAILGFTQLLKQKESDSSKLDLLKNVINAGNTLLKMLNDLLDLSKTSTATVGDKLSVVDLRKFLRELELVFLGPCSKKQLFFKIHVEEGLPSLLLLDRTKLKQVLMHLLDNAVKFTDEGGVTISVSLLRGKNERTSIDLLLSVKDTGRGIEKGHQKQIFNVFEKPKEDSFNEGSGVGLGLALCKQLLRFMGGRLNLKSDVGEGSEFKVTIPNVEIALKEVENVPKLEAVDGDSSRVLIVDNKEFNRATIEKVCEAYHCDIEEASNGVEVLKKARSFLPDVIFLDMEISKLNGFELVRILREDEHMNDVQIIALSTVEQQRARALEVCNGFILKPINQLEVKYLLESSLNKKSS